MNKNEEQKLPPIVTLTDPRAEVLNLVSKSCSIPPSPEDIQAADYAERLLEELDDNAVALAAPQIAIPRRFFVMRLKDGNIKTFFNPIIIDRSNSASRKTEGCLSVTGAAIRVNRPRSLQLEYIDRTGGRHTEEFSGLQARAICHEVDHLNGKTIMEHMSIEAERLSKIANTRLEAKKKRVAKRRNKNKAAKLAKRRNRR